MFSIFVFVEWILCLWLIVVEIVASGTKMLVPVDVLYERWLSYVRNENKSRIILYFVKKRFCFKKNLDLILCPVSYVLLYIRIFQFWWFHLIVMYWCTYVCFYLYFKNYVSVLQKCTYVYHDQFLQKRRI